jgi:predicted nucleotidyltransferase
MPSIVTANRIGDGAVVYLAPSARWTVDIKEAEVAPDKTALAALEAVAAQTAAEQRVVSVYSMEVGLNEGRPAPLSMREKIRAQRGPTIPALPRRS